MMPETLNGILLSHAGWLKDDTKGERAVLRGANLRRAVLRGANLRRADLSDADLSDADLSDADLSDADLSEANLRGANLSGANLSGAKLRGANLRQANLDYSAWPLWCGSLDVKVNARLFRQLAYHMCRVSVDGAGAGECVAAQTALRGVASKFHRIGECGGLTNG